MAKTDLTSLITSYERVCNKIVTAFCDKHNIYFDFWMWGKVGAAASFNGEYVFNMEDIILDLTTNQPVGNILIWASNTMNNNDIEVNYTAYLNKTKCY